jgi:hypothetical protein
MISRLVRRSATVISFASVLVLFPFRHSFSQERNPADPSGGASATPVRPAHPLTVEEKFDFYLKKTYGPGAWLTSASSAGVRQWLDSPPEWGQGMEGYGRRFASSMGRKTIKNTVQFGVGAALREDPRYFPSTRRGFLPRVWHAVSFTFAPRNDNGERTLGVSRVAGALTAGFVSNTWYPDRLSDTSHALSRAGLMLGGDAGMNLLREFWPDLKRAIRGH